MEFTELLPGTKVDVAYVSDRDGGAGGDLDDRSFYTSIYDLDENGIMIYVPTSNGRHMFAPVETELELTFHMSRWIFRAEGIVTKTERQGSISLMYIVLSTGLTRVQRREYYRLECTIPMAYRVVDESVIQAKTNEDAQLILQNESSAAVRGFGTILDISGGGARIVSANSLEGVKYIQLTFKVLFKDVMTEMQVFADIIRSSYLEDEKKYIHHMQFCYKEERTKENIIGYVFEEERRIRKKLSGA